MLKAQNHHVFAILILTVLSTLSCQKKGGFIDEDKVGSGIHYYPMILNDNYYDTITKKFFRDTAFSAGQQIVFLIKYQSIDPLSSIELWVSSPEKKAEKVWETAYSSSFYSELQKSDTTYINFHLAEKIDSSVNTITLHPKVLTQKGLVGESSVELQLRR